MANWQPRSSNASLKTLSLSVAILVLLTVLQGLPVEADDPDGGDDAAASDDDAENTDDSTEEEQRVIGSFYRRGEALDLTEHQAQDHPQGLRVRAPPGSSSMRIDPAFLEEKLGEWGASGKFRVGDDGFVEVDHRIAVFKEVALNEKPIFTLGTGKNIQFESRPMWVSIEEAQSGFILDMEDGDTTGQKVFLSNAFLSEMGVHRPVVTHEDGYDVQVEQAADGSGYWLEVPHFTKVHVTPDDMMIWKRDSVGTWEFGEEPEWDTATNELFVNVPNNLVDIELLFERAWFNTNMPYLGLVGHTWEEETYEGDVYYKVALESEQTPTVLHFMQFRPDSSIDDYVYTYGNPTNLYLFPFDDDARKEYGLIGIKTIPDDQGFNIRVYTDGAAYYELLVAAEWIEETFEEHPVFERQKFGGPWVSLRQEPLVGGSFIVSDMIGGHYKFWDSLEGPLIPPEYATTGEGVTRGVAGCGLRHVVIVENGTLAQEGPACITNNQIFELVDTADHAHWMYDPEPVADTIYDSAARLCSMLIETTATGEVNWAGSPCLDYTVVTETPPSFLNNLCSSSVWSVKSHSAFCSDGLTRYQSAGMAMNVASSNASVMADILFSNDALMDALNDAKGNQSLQDEWAWIEDVRNFLHVLRFDQPCLQGLGLVAIESSLPLSMCGRSVNEFTENNSTTSIDMASVEAAWDLLSGGSPCDSSRTSLVVLGNTSEAYCGAQMPHIRDPVREMLDSVDWSLQCDERGVVLAGFENASSSWTCVSTIPDPDASLDTALIDTGVTTQSICYTDTNSTGQYSVGDSVYLAFSSCNGTVEANDLRLFHPNYGSGTKVSAGSTQELGQSYVAPVNSSVFRYHDSDGDKKPGSLDQYYLCIGDPIPCGDQVDVGWLRITGSGLYQSGSVVGTGDSDLATTVTGENLSADLGEHFRYWDEGGNSGVFDENDVMYWLAAGSTTTPSPGNIRLGPYANTNGFGEVLEVGMADEVEGPWERVRSWSGCASEVSFLLDAAATVPGSLCGVSTSEIGDSISFVQNFTEEYVGQNTVCGPDTSPLVIVDQVYATPSVICATTVASGGQAWDDAFADLLEINPCDGEAILVSPRIGDQKLETGGVDRYNLCGQIFDDPLGSVQTVFDEIEDCASGADSWGFSPVGIYQICGNDLDADVPDIRDTPNPCGAQDLTIPADSEIWSSRKSEICGEPIPDVGGWVPDVLENPPDECQLIGFLGGVTQGGEPSLCGTDPGDLDDAIRESNPCADGLDYVVGFNPGSAFAICGDKLGEVLQLVDEIVEQAPCDLAEGTVGSEELCGVPIEINPPECDSPTTDISTCVTYVYNGVQEQSTYVGMPGAFFDTSGNVDGLAWLIGAPIINIPNECTSQPVCLEVVGISGHYTTAVPMGTAGDLISLDAEFENQHIGIETEFRRSSESFTSLSGAMYFDDSIWGNLLFSSKNRLTTKAYGGVDGLELGLQQETSGWATEFAGTIDGSTSDQTGALDITIDWRALSKKTLLTSIVDDEGPAELEIDKMPEEVLGVQIISVWESDYNQTHVTWPSEERLNHVALRFGEIEVRIENPPRGFVADVVTEPGDQSSVPWTDLVVEFRPYNVADGEHKLFVPDIFREAIYEPHDASGMQRMKVVMDIRGNYVAVSDMLAAFKLAAGYSGLESEASSGHQSLIPPFTLDLLSGDDLPSDVVFAEMLKWILPDEFYLEVHDLADVLLDLRRDTNKLDVHFGPDGFVNVILVDSPHEGAQTRMTLHAECTQLAGNMYLETYQDDQEYTVSDDEYHGYLNETSGYMEFKFAESQRTTCSSEFNPTFNLGVLETTDLSWEGVLYFEEIETVKLNFSLEEHSRLINGEPADPECEGHFRSNNYVDVAAPDGIFRMNTGPLGGGNVTLTLDQVFLFDLDHRSYEGTDYLNNEFTGPKETAFSWAKKKGGDLDFWTKFTKDIIECNTERMLEFDVSYHETVFGTPKDRVELNTENIGIACNTVNDVKLNRDEDDSADRCLGGLKFGTLYGTLGLNNP